MGAQLILESAAASRVNVAIDSQVLVDLLRSGALSIDSLRVADGQSVQLLQRCVLSSCLAHSSVLSATNPAATEHKIDFVD